MPSTAQDPLARMRAHKGNTPTLPQTKHCSLCPAKFTRTTHLNRHLRSHNNDRIYRCNLCQSAEFTRSDLLIRHKRTRVNRYRKTACESCAESKIKCNLEYPCAKCTSRGRECVFKFHPNKPRSKSPESRNSSSACSTRGSIPPAPATSSSPSSHILSLPELVDCAGSSGASSLLSSPRSETFPVLEEHRFDFSFDIGAYDNAIISPFDGGVFSAPSSGSALTCGGASDSFSLRFDEEMDLFAALIPVPSPPPPPPPSLLVGSSRNVLVQPTVTLDYVNPLAILCIFGAASATKDMYLHLFFTRFLAQVPLLHAPTWRMADTPAFLGRVFQACGALFLDTPEAAAFVATTLSSSAAEMTAEFSKVNDRSEFDERSSRHHTHVIVGLVLLQTISLLRREGERAAPPNAQLHAMLVAMIRQTGLIARVASWSAPDFTASIPLESTWIEWAKWATIKRAVLLAYLQDCCHCMYAASPPAFLPAEMHIPLPCDDALWCAPTATKWFEAAHTPSPYGVGSARIRGTSMQTALAALATPTTPAANANITAGAARPPLTSFGLFILIHTLLRNISIAQRSPTPGSWSCFEQADGGAAFTVRAQMMLDNWLQIWVESPEAAPQASGEAAQTPPFVCNSLPFYWLAQVALWENSWSGPAFIDSGSFDPLPSLATL
ncbi:hypothetical protein B0H14DRAFT_2972275 [Mycena olivaceomarginata]|nr:hypothetical protein B0H14DRAFT_2972275 [Mycena olivaceomarginata]